MKKILTSGVLSALLTVQSSVMDELGKQVIQ